MLPPIRRAEKTADQVFKGRGTSSNPPLFDSKNRGHKDKKVFASHYYKSAWSEVLVLQVVKESPGLSIVQISQKTKFSREKVKQILRDYRNDQLVRYERVGRQYFWYLED